MIDTAVEGRRREAGEGARVHEHALTWHAEGRHAGCRDACRVQRQC